MDDKSVGQPSRTAHSHSLSSQAESVVDACLPTEKNVKGPERTGRAIIGVGVGSFGIIGSLGVSQPVLAAALAVGVLVMTAYLLATAKTQKCPAKHLAK